MQQVSENSNQARTYASASTNMSTTHKGKGLTSNAPRGDLLGLPTPRHTILCPYEGLERLRRVRRSLKRKERKLGGKEWSEKSNGRDEKWIIMGVFIEKGKKCQRKGVGSLASMTQTIGIMVH